MGLSNLASPRINLQQTQQERAPERNLALNGEKNGDSYYNL